MEITLTDQKGKKKYVAEYYKKLFGKEDRGTIEL